MAKFPTMAVLVAAVVMTPVGAAAQGARGAEGEALIRALARCRDVPESAARLACFDSATARLVAAEQAGEVVVIDRAQARAARRQAFGFNLPSLDIFNRGEREPRIDRVQLVLASAGRSGDGRWVMRTTEGQVWRQIDQNQPYNPPRAGSRVDIRTAAFGSFFMNIDGQKAIRVRREQ